MTTGTAGKFCLWSLPGPLTPQSPKMELERCLTRRIHQNAVNYLTSESIGSDGGYLVMSTGDDNALCFSTLRLENEGEHAKRTGIDRDYVMSTLRIANAHAAAVSAAVVVSSTVTDLSSDAEALYRLRIVTAGKEQRVKVWDVVVDRRKTDVGGLEVSMVKDQYTAVADVSSMAVLATTGETMGIVICGIGIQVLMLD